MGRLLTTEQMQTIVGDYYQKCAETEPQEIPLAMVIAEKISEAQDSKTYKETLKAVGKWLDGKEAGYDAETHSIVFVVKVDEFETLKRGEMPK